MPSFILLSFRSAGTENCQNMGTMAPPSYYNLQTTEFVLQPGEFITRFGFWDDTVFESRIAQIDIDTSTGRKVTLGSEYHAQWSDARYRGATQLSIGSGVLDGFVFSFGPMRYVGMPEVDVLMGVGPIFLQRYTSLSFDIGAVKPDVPVDLPSVVNSYDWQVMRFGCAYTGRVLYARTSSFSLSSQSSLSYSQLCENG
jgi:hypothetical protein